MIQGSQAWHAYRRTHIGASEAAIILNCSPYKTPYRLWAEKIGLMDPDAPNAAMQRGIDLEPIAREKFIETTGITVFPAVVEHSTLPWMSASLDGHNLKNDVLEIKCAGRKDHETALSGRVPEKYRAQLQHQMAVIGADKVYYYSFDGTDGCIVIVNRDDAYIKEMIEKEREFYRCMIELEAPPLTDRDYVERNDQMWKNTALDYIATKQKREELESREESLKDALVTLSCNQPSFGSGVRVQKIIKKGSIQYDKIEALKEINLDVYRKPRSEYWKISEA